ncbi:uncharacterized protein MONBRDRAFT_9503, partial [Monosiga brevicollis MX1]
MADTLPAPRPPTGNREVPPRPLSGRGRVARAFEGLEGMTTTLSGKSQSEAHSDKTIDLDKVLQLLEDEYSRDLLERHLHALAKVAKRNARGYRASDAPALARLVACLAQRIANGADALLDPLINCIVPLQHSFVVTPEMLHVRQQVHDLQTGICELLDELGNLLSVPQPRLCVSAIETMHAIVLNLDRSILEQASVLGDALHMTASLHASLNGSLRKAAPVRDGPSQAKAESEPAARILGMVARAILSSNFVQDAAAALTRAFALSTPAHPSHSKSDQDSTPHALNPSSAPAALSDDMQRLLLDILNHVGVTDHGVGILLQGSFLPLLSRCLAQQTQEFASPEGALVLDLLLKMLAHPQRADFLEQSTDELQTVAVCLYQALQRAAFEGNSQTRRAIRNDILLLVTLASDIPAARAALLEANVLELVVDLLRSADLNSARHLDLRRLRWTTAPEDFDFAKTAFTLLAQYSQEPAACKVLEDAGLVPVLMAYLHKDGEQLARSWSAPQFEELQLVVLSLLAQILPRVPRGYTDVRGNGVLVNLLAWAMQDSPGSTGPEARLFAGAGNAFHATGDFAHARSQQPVEDLATNNGHRSLIKYILRSLLALVNDPSPDLLATQHDLLDQGLATLLIDFLDEPLPKRADSIFFDLKMYALMILGALCLRLSDARDQIGARGVETVLAYLRDSQHTPNALIIASLDALWAVVDGSALNLRTFLQHEGAFLILDLLETGPVNLHSLLMGFVADLCDHDDALRHFLQWQGSGNPRASIASLLCRLWRDCNTRIGCPHLEAGSILNIALAGTATSADLPTLYPLSCGSGPLTVESDEARPGTQPSPAILEVLENERSRIFAIASAITFQRCRRMLDLDDQ